MICLQPSLLNHMEKNCLVCNLKLIGRKRKFCSNQCKNQFTNRKHQNYISQQKRGRNRRSQLIEMKGGACQKYGYNKNLAALSFHHTDAKTKSFSIDLRSCSNNSWKTLLAEFQKCSLLCLNCHAEMHNPNFST